jgi:hypothetical protein
MKQKDLILIVVIAAIGIIASLFISNLIFVTPQNRQQEVVVVQPISTNFPKPNAAYFNSSSIDPTKLITIGKNSNNNPF